MSEYSSNQSPTFEPTSIQLDREKALKRFNMLYVYLPIALGTLIVLGVMGFLVWITFGERAESTLTAVSGLADLILILILLPIVLIGLLGPIALGGLIYWLYQQRKKKAEHPQDEHGILIQKYTWQIEQRSDTLLAKLQDILSKIAPPIIQINARLESIERAIQKLWNKSIEE